MCTFLAALSTTELELIERLAVSEMDWGTVPLTTKVAEAVFAAAKGNHAKTDITESATRRFR